MRVYLIYDLILKCLVLHLVYVICAHAQSVVEVCSDGDIRLAGGTSYLVGRVEVCHGNQWGTVCDDSFDDAEAEVVCRQLGYSSEGASLAADEDYTDGTEDQQIILDDLLCGGSEDKLVVCPKQGNCFHNEDAGVRCQHDAVRLTLDGNLLPNNTIIQTDDFSDSNNNGIALLCVTNKQPCCSTQPNRFGEWYYPNGTQLQNQASGYVLYRGRGDNQSVRLNRRTTAALETIPDGIYHCEVPDKNDVTQYLYIGLYSDTEGIISISDMTYDTDTQTLICTSTGGPATIVTWTKDNTPLNIDGALYEHSQIIMDLSESVYENRLRFINQASVSSGTYSCTVTNNRGSDTRELDVSVCMTGESRVLGITTADLPVQLEVCFDNEWFAYTVTSAQRGTVEPLPPTVMPPSFTIQTNVIMSSVEVSWTPPELDSQSITSYQVTCSSHDTIQQQRHTVSITTAPIPENTVTLHGLMTLTLYECCVTAYINPMVTIATTCDMVTTGEESIVPDNTMAPCTTIPSVTPAQSTSSVVPAALGAVVGVLILALIVVMTALCILIIMMKRPGRSKPSSSSSSDQSTHSYVTRQPTRPVPFASRVRDERLLTNPIYSPVRPRTNTAASMKSVNIPNPIYSSTTTVPQHNSKPDSNYASIPDLDSKPKVDSNYAEIDLSHRNGPNSTTAAGTAVQPNGRTANGSGGTYAEIDELNRNENAPAIYESQI